MPRIMITAVAGIGSDGLARQPVLDERVNTDCLNDDHASLRLLERICWAIEDAEKQEYDEAEPKQRHEHDAAGDTQHPDRFILGVA